MSASIFSFSSLRLRRENGPKPTRQDWSQQELAELYRVRDRLLQSGLGVAVETGLTDEGEPWAVFLQSETGDAFVHIARLAGSVVVANLLANVIYRGADFRAITDQMLADAPLVLPRAKPGDAKVVMHPRSVFTAFVAAAIVLSELVRTIEPARASDADKAVPDTKALFPQLFDRLLARDTGWNGAFGLTAAAASLMTAAVGAVLLSDHGDGADDQVQQVAAAAAAREATRSEAATVLAANEARSESDRSDAPADTTVELRGDGQRIALATVDDLRELSPALRPGAQPEREGTPPEPPHTAANGHDQPSPGLEALPEAPEKARIVKTSATTGPAAEGAAANAASDGTTVTTEKAETTSGQATSKEIAVISGSIVVASLPASAGERGLSELVTQALARVEPERAPDDAADIVVTVDTSTPAVQPAKTGAPDWVLFTQSPVSAPVKLSDGKHDVVLFTGQDTKIYNFRFNEDYLLVNGALDKTDWIKSIEIHGDDVVIQAIGGGTVWLIDTHGLIA